MACEGLVLPTHGCVSYYVTHGAASFTLAHGVFLFSPLQELDTHQSFFMQWGIYLLLEKLKLLAYRNLFKRVCVHRPRVTATKVSYASRYAVVTFEMSLFFVVSLFFSILSLWVHVLFSPFFALPVLSLSLGLLRLAAAVVTPTNNSFFSVRCGCHPTFPVSTSAGRLLHPLTSSFLVSQPQSWCALPFP